VGWMVSKLTVLQVGSRYSNCFVVWTFTTANMMFPEQSVQQLCFGMDSQYSKCKSWSRLLLQQCVFGWTVITATVFCAAQSVQQLCC